MTIWFDMDGTIADLYSVENWLPMLRAYDPSPYMLAKPLVRLSTLAYMLNRLRAKGYRVGVISWGSKCSTPAYDERNRINWGENAHTETEIFDILKSLT